MDSGGEIWFKGATTLDNGLKIGFPGEIARPAADATAHADRSQIEGGATYTYRIRAFNATGGADRPPRWADFADPLDAIGARFRDRMKDQVEREDGRPLSGRDREAMRTLSLEIDSDRTALRKRYSELVRRYHPDRNGGDRRYETRLQQVIAAYQQLKGSPAFA